MGDEPDSKSALSAYCRTTAAQGLAELIPPSYWAQISRVDLTYRVAQRSPSIASTVFYRPTLPVHAIKATQRTKHIPGDIACANLLPNVTHTDEKRIFSKLIVVYVRNEPFCAIRAIFEPRFWKTKQQSDKIGETWPITQKVTSRISITFRSHERGWSNREKSVKVGPFCKKEAVSGKRRSLYTLYIERA